MRYLIVSKKGKSLGLAHRLEQEGHGVIMHIVQPASQRKGAGLVSILRTPRPIMDSDGIYNLSAIEWLMSTARPDITIFDSPSTHVMATRMQGSGHRVLGVITDVIADCHERSPYSVTGFFNGTKFLDICARVTHYNALFNDDIGPRTPMGATCEFIDGHPILNDLAVRLRATAYRGPVVAYLEPSGVLRDYFVGFSPVTNLLFEGLAGSVSQLFVDCVNGMDTPITRVTKYAAAVRVTLPPFPYWSGQRVPCETIHGINEGNLKHFWPNDLCYNQGVYSTTGESNDLGYFTARGDTVREAQRRVYRTIRNLAAPAIQYRTDIGATNKEVVHV